MMTIQRKTFLLNFSLFVKSILTKIPNKFLCTIKNL